jgi:hypothetical protein
MEARARIGDKFAGLNLAPWSSLAGMALVQIAICSAFAADSVLERPVSRAFWQKQISTLLFQLNDLHQNLRDQLEALTDAGLSQNEAS